MRMNEISEMLKLGRPTATRIISSLEDKGWVETAVGRKDKRVRTVALTQEGKNVLIIKKTELESIMGILD